MAEVVQLDLGEPPEFCQYAEGPCDQQLPGTTPSKVFLAFPSNPIAISTTIEEASRKLRAASEFQILPWTDLKIAGQTIFCEICKSLRQSVAVVADVTTLNFNLMFEIGYVLGLGIPVIPIRDTSFVKDKRLFDEIGILDTLGYVDFQNSDELCSKLLDALPGQALPKVQTREFREAPLYVLKGPLNTEGAVRMLSTIKKSGIKFRSHDPIETPRISLHEVRRQVAGSVGVVSNILDAHREHAPVHNAQSALVAGIAMAQQKAVALLLEGDDSQPIDYRDVVQSYSNPNNIPGLLQPFLHRVVERMQASAMKSLGYVSDVLHKVDLGDVAAENEVVGLRSYFVPTGQSTQAKQGHARLVVGRKGSGKAQSSTRSGVKSVRHTTA